MQDKERIKKLIKQAMRGNAAAFDKLAEMFSSDVLYHARTQLDDKEEAADVSQEVWMSVYRNITNLKSPYAFYSYLQQTIRNICIQRNLKQRRIRTEDVDNHVDTLVAVDEVDPQEHLDKLSDVERMTKLLATLPDRQRETLYLYYYRQLTYKEIAELQNVSINTVGVNISKAKASLRKMM